MRTLTIEDMIRQGASWKEIEAVVKAIQKEEEERKAAERAKAKAEATRAKRSAAAIDRIVAGFTDWFIAEGLLSEEEREGFAKMSREGFDELAKDVKQMMLFGGLFRR